MPIFTFELVREQESHVLIDQRWLADEKIAWCHTEYLAVCQKDESTAQILVRNAEGDIVILCGLRNAIASARKCSVEGCRMKQLIGGVCATEAEP